MNIEGAKTAREPKYRELEYAIDGLHAVVKRFDGLIDAMDNGPGPKVEGAPTNPPHSSAFQSVYDGASSRIQEATSALENILSSFRTRLF